MLSGHYFTSLGWNSRWEAFALDALGPQSERKPTQCVGRINNQERDRYRVSLEDGASEWATVRGRMLHASTEALDLPVVGDWVVCFRDEAGGSFVIESVLPRKGILARKGVNGSAQPIASNVDVVFVASSLNADLSLNRIDRYVTLAWDAGAVPVVVLTKRDLLANWESLASDVVSRFPGLDVFAVTIAETETLAPLASLLAGGRTGVVVGSSGVGKSTLINALVGQEVLKTQSSRDGDDKGRHTTTSRSLWLSASGGVVIDTPGMREIAMMDNENGLERAFEDVTSIASGCRFKDCAHVTEPGCAIRAALESGDLSAERWRSFTKLRREIEYEARKSDKVAMAAQKEKWKRIQAANRTRK